MALARSPQFRPLLAARLGAGAALLALAISCTKAPERAHPSDPVQSHAAASSAPALRGPTLGADRDASPRGEAASTAVSALELSRLGQSTFEFAVDLERTLARDGAWATRNIVLSPYSLSEAFGMVYAGARGETAQEIARTLHYGLDDSKVHAGLAMLRAEIAEIGATSVPSPRAPVEILVANSLWAQEGFGIAPAYSALVADRYAADVRNVNFAGAPEQARGQINAWVKERTRGFVPELFPRGALATSTPLVLVDTVYLRGTWEQPFPRAATRPGSFEKLDGRPLEVPIMSRVLNAGYLETPDYQAVELRYVGDRLSLLVILPARGKFARTEEQLNATLLHSIAVEVPRTRRQVDFSMPKFALSLPLSLSGPLAQLGMKRAFTPSADFTGMVTSVPSPPFIEQVRHHVHFAVDEEQTEAAAASGVVMSYSAASEKATVHLDRPFFLGIHDKRTNVLLFWGRVVDPRAGD